MSEKFSSNLSPLQSAILRLLTDTPMQVNVIAAELGEERTIVGASLVELINLRMVQTDGDFYTRG